MTGSDSEKQAKFSKLSRSQYVLRFGVLGWGIPTAILFALIRKLSTGFGWIPIPADPRADHFPARRNSLRPTHVVAHGTTRQSCGDACEIATDVPSAVLLASPAGELLARCMLAVDGCRSWSASL